MSNNGNPNGLNDPISDPNAVNQDAPGDAFANFDPAQYLRQHGKLRRPAAGNVRGQTDPQTHRDPNADPGLLDDLGEAGSFAALGGLDGGDRGGYGRGYGRGRYGRGYGRQGYGQSGRWSGLLLMLMDGGPGMRTAILGVGCLVLAAVGVGLLVLLSLLHH